MKYSVGDYVANEKSIFLKIEAAFPGEQPIYGVLGVKHGKIHRQWISEYMLDKEGIVKGNPEFEKWAKIKQGDLIFNGQTYIKVMARVGDLVMTSETPTAPDERKKNDLLHDLASQIEKLTNGDIKSEQVEDVIPKNISISEAHKIPHDHWHSVEDLALMNWQLMGGE